MGHIPFGVLSALVCSAILASAVVWSDYRLANTQRDAAQKIMRDFGDRKQKVFFLGHWGFQYYMEAHGATAYDLKAQPDVQGDYIVIPSNNTNLAQPPRKYQVVKEYRLLPAQGVSTMERIQMGAGFYASVWGPLPYCISQVPDETYKMFKRMY
jgi:hypothetical protein